MSKTRKKRPVIKWSGSKRKIAPYIGDLLPSGRCYYEPFVGSGALLPFHNCDEAIASDIIPELISLWKKIKNSPSETAKKYRTRWKRLQDEGHTAYYDIRSSFNENRNPFDFLFLSRTCVNGLIRFNKDGDFNNSLHHGRPGISPDTLKKIIFEWSHYIQDVEFRACDYRKSLSQVSSEDVVFLDPPYGGTQGRYLPDPFDMEALFEELKRLNELGARWVITLDGEAGERDYDTELPENLYDHKLGLATGNAPFRKLTGAAVEQVVESVYLNFEPPGSVIDQLRDQRDEEFSSGSRGDMEDGTLF
jgi:DNA adenine methylase